MEISNVGPHRALAGDAFIYRVRLIAIGMRLLQARLTRTLQVT